MPAIHIGILDYTLFPEHPEFYARYAIKNIINNNIYSDKFLLHVLDLNHPELATEEDITCGLQYWAQLFKAKTWEDLHMLASEYEVFEDITDTVEQALADKKIRMECEARERYERDRISLYASGHKTGKAEGFNEAIIKYITNVKTNTNISKADAVIQLVDYFGLSTQDATTLVNEHWK